MSKHSFAPKLTHSEYLTLTSFSADWRKVTSDYANVQALASRGLLDTEREPHQFSGWNAPTHRFRLSRRGELMRQRYGVELAARQWADKPRESVTS